MTTTPDTTETQPTAAGDDTPAGLRATIDRLRSERDEARAVNRRNVLDHFGLSAEKGQGKAILSGYEGPWTKESIAQYAKTEFDWDLVATAATPTPVAEPTVDPSLIVEGQQRQDALAAAAVPVQDVKPTNEDLAWQHEREGGVAAIQQAIGLRIAKNLT